MTYLVIYTIFMASISVASASALFSDVFFFISQRHRRLKKNESYNLRYFMGVSSSASIIAGVALISLLSLRISAGVEPQDYLLMTIAFLLTIAFGCSITLRNFHLPSLHRHQHEYHHLSESMTYHQDSLLRTSIVSFISWLYIITLLSADSRGLISTPHFLNIIISYIVLSYVLSKLIVFAKKRLS